MQGNKSGGGGDGQQRPTGQFDRVVAEAVTMYLGYVVIRGRRPAGEDDPG